MLSLCLSSFHSGHSALCSLRLFLGLYNANHLVELDTIFADLNCEGSIRRSRIQQWLVVVQHCWVIAALYCETRAFTSH